MATPPGTGWVIYPSPIPGGVTARAVELLNQLAIGQSTVERDPASATHEAGYVCETHPGDARHPQPHKGITVWRRAADGAQPATPPAPPPAKPPGPPAPPHVAGVRGWPGYDHAVLVDPDGVRAVLDVAPGLGISRRQLAWDVEIESKWNPEAQNPDPPKGTGASGLIQWIPTTAHGLGTSVAALRTMSRAAQAPYIQRYLAPFVGHFAKPTDSYLAIASGNTRFLSRPDSDVVGAVDSVTWAQNPAWRGPHNGPVTIGSIRAYGTPPGAGGPDDGDQGDDEEKPMGTLAKVAFWGGIAFMAWKWFSKGAASV